jgi:glycerol-3-phosphate responsive antiterminator
MSPEAVRAVPRLPAVLVADDGAKPIRLPHGVDAGILLRDIDLPNVVERAANRDCVLALDLDSVRGMETDEAAAQFTLETLGVGIVMTRRRHVAAWVSANGGIGLLHTLAFDSTGVARSLDGSSRELGIGTVISPGPVLIHMRPSERQQLARPIVAYGLLSRPEDALACLRLAECVVLRQDVARALAASGPAREQHGRNVLTTVLAEE